MKMPQEMLLHWERVAPDQVLFHQPQDRQWTEYTWSEALRQARCVATALSKLGVGQGDRVAILSKNCAHWFMADFACMILGAVSVPIYPTANARTVSYVLEHCEARVLFVGKVDDPNAWRSAVGGGIQTIAFPYPEAGGDLKWETMVSESEPCSQMHIPSQDDLMTILYTSGSTGNPKGAEHTYASFAYAGQNLGEYLNSSEKDRLLSYLPLAHCTERAYVEAAAIYNNGNLFFVESLNTFMDDLRYTEPTFFGSVPRLWKRFQLGVFEKTPEDKLKRLLRIPLVRSIVAAKIRNGLGLNSARWCGSGTAPIAPSLLHWWESIGLPISEGWGMTETFAYGTQLNEHEEYRTGSIGKALPGVELKIGDGNEILIKCPTMMVGYYKQPELTAEVLEDGWLKTGDCGHIDQDGYVFITGRAKEIFKTSKGKYVAPVPIESLLLQNPLIEIACVMGLGMTQPVALVLLPSEGIADMGLARQRLADTLKTVNHGLESHERLDRLIVVKDDWTVENGLLTPTLKVKRSEVEKHYSSVIEISEGEVWFEVTSG